MLMYDEDMRTTLDIDEDILAVAKQIARQRRATLGTVISELVRESIQPKRSITTRNGVPLFTPKPGALKPSLELVNRLRDGE